MQSVVQTVSQPPLPQRQKQRLCLGGSFNPIHVGHLICARIAAEQAGYGGVRLIPTGTNPHKGTADLAAAADRVTLCQLAVAGDPFFVVDDREARRPGPSYTFDTAAELAAETGGRVAWLVGTDLLARLHTWHRFDELLEQTDMVVMRRAGHPIERAGLDPRVARLAEAAVVVPAIELSATMLRARIRNGLPLDHFLPPAVARHIESHGLYR